MALYDENAEYWKEGDSFANFANKYLLPHNAADYFGVNTAGRLVNFVSDVLNGTLLQSPVQTSAYSEAIDNGASITDALNNSMTGNVDYERTKELIQSEQAFNASEAEKQRQWYERMSNTAYQRAAEDLKSAGYNPALLLGNAGAASSAYGSAASVGSHAAPNASNSSAMILSSVASALLKVLQTAASPVPVKNIYINK